MLIVVDRSRCLVSAMLRSLVLVFLVARPALAQKTDVVTLVNGDKLTCEIKLLNFGRLEVKTDHIGTVYVEWDKISSIAATRLFRVETSTGLRLLGRLSTTAAGQLDVVQDTGPVRVDQLDVVYVAPVGLSFWRQLDGGFDLGFSYTQSSGIATLNFDADATYRRTNVQFTATMSSYFTVDNNGNDTARHALEFGSARNFGRQWLWLVQGGFMRNQELGYNVRGTVSAGLGRYLVRSNRAIFAVGGGLSTSREVPVEGESSQQLEALVSARHSFFTYDSPKTDIGVVTNAYPSLSDWGRFRMELDGHVKRELFKDFMFGFTIYDSFDSRPPTEAARKNDVGISLTFGWTF